MYYKVWCSVIKDKKMKRVFFIIGFLLIFIFCVYVFLGGCGVDSISGVINYSSGVDDVMVN